MENRTIAVIAGLAAACLAGGLAGATATVGTVFNNVLATGTINKDIDTRARIAVPDTDGGDDGWSAKVETDGASNFVVQDVAFVPGGYTGWHNHPGILFLTLTEGSVEWYDAGDSWTENTPLHYVRAVGSVNARFMITYVIAKGQPKRIDQAAPACAAALGLF
jgi:hypothetical protein